MSRTPRISQSGGGGGINVTSSNNLPFTHPVAQSVFSRLLPHQQQGVLWIQKNEAASLGGGIIADDPGLGKTRMLLAHAMLTSNFPTKFYRLFFRHSFTKNGTLPTKFVLVVTPLAICHQWLKEAHLLFNPVGLGDCVDQHVHVITNAKEAKQCLARLIDKQQEEFAPFALSSSSTLSSNTSPEKVTPPTSDGATLPTCLPVPVHIVVCGYSRLLAEPLFRNVTWTMTILDEAHTARNAQTALFTSLMQLKTGVVWCCTATPINNSWEDMLSLCQLIKDEPYCKRTWWQAKHYSPNEADRRRQYWLDTYVLERHRDVIQFALPPFTKQQVVCHLSTKEQEWVNYIRHHRWRLLQPTFTQAHDHAHKNGMSSLLCSLRIRRLATHATLVHSDEGNNDNDEETDDCEDDDTMMDESVIKKSPVQDFVIKSPVQDLVVIKSPGQLLPTLPDNNSACASTATSPSTSPFAHVRKMRCWMCSQPAQYALPCGRHFECLPPESLPLTLSNTPIATTSSCTVCEMKGQPPTVGTRMENLRALVLDICGPADELVPRTPSGRVPKVVIISQWSQSLHVARTNLETFGYNCALIDGQMPIDQRVTACCRFDSDPQLRILLLGAQVGSAGLNLHVAQYVIWLEALFNPATEDQGDCRCYRLGQIDPTFSIRLVIPSISEEMVIVEEIHRVKKLQSHFILNRERQVPIVTTFKPPKSHSFRRRQSPRVTTVNTLTNIHFGVGDGEHCSLPVGYHPILPTMSPLLGNSATVTTLADAALALAPYVQCLPTATTTTTTTTTTTSNSSKSSRVRIMTTHTGRKQRMFQEASRGRSRSMSIAPSTQKLRNHLRDFYAK